MLVSSTNRINFNYQKETTIIPVPTDGDQNSSSSTYGIDNARWNTKSTGLFTNSIHGGIIGNYLSNNTLNKDSSEGIKDFTKNPQVSSIINRVGFNVGVGAIIHGSFSIIKQTYALAIKQQNLAGAGANLITDITRGAASGLGATVIGGAASIAMKALGSTGTLGTIVTIIGGAIGANVGANIVEKTGLRKGLVNAFGA